MRSSTCLLVRCYHARCTVSHENPLQPRARLVAGERVAWRVRGRVNVAPGSCLAVGERIRARAGRIDAGRWCVVIVFDSTMYVPN